MGHLSASCTWLVFSGYFTLRIILYKRLRQLSTFAGLPFSKMETHHPGPSWSLVLKLYRDSKWISLLLKINKDLKSSNSQFLNFVLEFSTSEFFTNFFAFSIFYSSFKHIGTFPFISNIQKITLAIRKNSFLLRMTAFLPTSTKREKKKNTWRFSDFFSQ